MRYLLIILLGLTVGVIPAKAESLNVTEEEILNAVRQEFVDRGIAEDKNLDLELFGGQTNFQIDGAQEAKILINNFNADENLGRFRCEAEIFADRNSVYKSQLQGKYFLMTTVWVPAKNIAKGEVITADMLQKKVIRKSKIKPFMVTGKDSLVGMSAQHSLREDKIISDKDIGAKIAVQRNDIVLAIYRTPQMQITTKAIAQQDGAVGQRIELQNAKTRKMLTGVVQDASTVVVDQ
ncbi:MAG: flagellar basal body P-ring formation protein FlgA [Alphaproteobacteria bacterium]|nr:flagellar basal body P-ring formation protein FlgA [Alphaproteobacteria bacterium]